MIRRIHSKNVSQSLRDCFPSSLHALAQVSHLLTGFSPGDFLGFLDLADQWLSLAGYLLKILVGKLVPVLSGRTISCFHSFFCPSFSTVHCFLCRLATAFSVLQVPRNYPFVCDLLRATLCAVRLCFFFAFIESAYLSARTRFEEASCLGDILTCVSCRCSALPITGISMFFSNQ